MPDVTSVLERAAAEPARGPDLERPWRRRRVKRFGTAGAAVVGIAALAVVLAPRDPKIEVVNVAGPTTTPARVAYVDNAWLSVLPGWHLAPEPHAWWLTSPKELFSVSSTPLPPSPHVEENEAICPSEIPRAVAENLPTDGAYLWIGKWQQNRLGYTTSPYKRFDERDFHPLCDLPRGLVARGTTVNNGETDYVVYYIVGPDTPNSLVRDIAFMVDSLRFDG
jgi:hypothetical protein